jgi:mannose-1-phosphate guanylyltransferase
VKAFLLAAGHGTRLRPLTDTVPKCLLPIRGTPMLEIWLQLCQRFSITEVLLNLHSHAALVRDFLSTRSNPHLEVNLVEESVLLGSAGTLRANRNWVGNDECFWIFYADVLASPDLAGMLRFHRECNPIATLGVYEVPDPSRCGIVTVASDGRVKKFVEKPTQPDGNLAFSGLMIGTPSLLDAIPLRSPVDIGFHLLPQLADRMIAYRLSDYVLDIGTHDNYQLAQRTWQLQGSLV